MFILKYKLIMKKILLFSLLLIFGCSNAYKKFNDDYIFYQDIESVKKLNSTLLFVEEPMMGDIECINNYVVLCSGENKNLIYIYSNEGDFIASVGTKGRASTEMLGITFSGQKDESKSTLYAIDVNVVKNVGIDISRSVDEGRLRFDSQYQTLPYSLNSFVKDDTTLLVEQLSGNNYMLNYLYSNEIALTKELYTPNSEAFMLYRAFCGYSPIKGKMVWAMNSVNSINLIDLESWTKRSLSVYTEPDFDGAINPKTKLPYHRYYCNIATTEKFIYALYMDQSKEDSYTKRKGMEIHVLDWDGNMKNKFVVDEYIIRITVSGDDRYIYAMDCDDNIYKYTI